MNNLIHSTSWFLKEIIIAGGFEIVNWGKRMKEERRIWMRKIVRSKRTIKDSWIAAISRNLVLQRKWSCHSCIT